MSVTAQPLPLPSLRRRSLWGQLGLAAAAVAIVGGVVMLLASRLSLSGPPTPVRAPFGLGLREQAPSATGIGGIILAVQGSFFKSLQAAVAALKESGTALVTLLGIGFAYGVFHAAGPGHGKAVIAAYLVASERALIKGFGLSLAAAVLQAIVAVVLVCSVAVLLNARATTMDQVTQSVEIASFAAVALLGAVITWRKAGKVLGIVALGRDPLAAPDAAACDHVHLPPPQALDRVTRWREMAGIVVSAGLRPCAGAIVVLVFALSQGFLAAGIAATFAMALGTALTTGALAALAVFAKALALRLAGGRGIGGAVAVAGLELLAAAFVLVLGLSLMAGLWTGVGAS